MKKNILLINLSIFLLLSSIVNGQNRTKGNKLKQAYEIKGSIHRIDSNRISDSKNRGVDFDDSTFSTDTSRLPTVKVTKPAGRPVRTKAPVRVKTRVFPR